MTYKTVEISVHDRSPWNVGTFSLMRNQYVPGLPSLSHRRQGQYPPYFTCINYSAFKTFYMYKVQVYLVNESFFHYPKKVYIHA